jgi:hypothetical protein
MSLIIRTMDKGAIRAAPNRSKTFYRLATNKNEDLIDR